jgi:glycosyltransferase involved in cell wall biosynthesis
MRITFVCPPPGLSGGIRVVAIYAERLAQRGHTVTVVHPPNKLPAMRDRLRSLLRGEGWARIPRLYESHLDGLTQHRHILERWRPVEDRDVPDADAVVATWWETAEWVAALAPAKGAKAYFIQHYETHSGQPVERVEQTWRLGMHKIVVSQWLANIARDRFGDSGVSIVPNSVDLDMFFASPRGKQPAPTVGFVYSTAQWKGADISTQAIDLARKTVPEIRATAFGMMDPESDLPVPPNTVYHKLPQQDAIREIYSSCDAWLMASRTEGFGLPILEAMACRTPVIAAPAGAAPELVGQGGGLLTAVEDPHGMADAIIQIARMTDAEWRRMSDRAHATATQYTWDDAVETFERALERAIGRKE